MKQLKCIFKLALLFTTLALSQDSWAQKSLKIGSNVTTIDSSAQLEVESTTKAFLPPRMTTVQRNAIVRPATGLVLFNIDLNCLQVNVGASTAPTWQCAPGINPSTGGTAEASSIGGSPCSANMINGALTAGIAVSGVTMTLHVNVTQVGTWNITSGPTNGVTFSGSGIFTGTGCRMITLTATGTPTASGSTTWNTNTIPAGSATATVAGGTITSIACAGATTFGTLSANSAASSGVSSAIQYIGGNGLPHGGQIVTSTGVTGLTATLTAGSFVSGDGFVTYNITGTPATSGTANFAINIGGQACTLTRTVTASVNSSSNGTAVVTSYNCLTSISNGLLFAGIRASGVSQTIMAVVQTPGSWNIVTAPSNGYFFFGEGNFPTPGSHPIVLTASGIPFAPTSGVNTFMLNTSPSCTFDRSVRNASSGGNAVIDSILSCNKVEKGSMTVGTAIPANSVSQTITVRVTTPGTCNISTAQVNGVTFSRSANLTSAGIQDIELNATAGPPVAAIASPYIYTINTSPSCSFNRTVSNLSSGGTAVFGGSPNCNGGVTGAMKVDTPVFGVSQAITVTVSDTGSWNIATAPINGVTFSGSGHFDKTGPQTLILNASGTPTAATASPYSYTINATPSCTFTRSVTHTSSGGTAVVTSYTCGTATGTMTARTEVSNVTQNITAIVQTAGSYNITATSNGVTFAGSGFIGSGSQNIVLTATGIPVESSTAIGYALNVSPTCIFTRTVLDPSSGGTAVFQGTPNCSTSMTGAMTANTMITTGSVTQTITVNVATAGSYNISTAPVNGVTFSGSGPIQTGPRTIELTATGTPASAAASPYIYTINTTPSCNFNRSVSDLSSGGTAVFQGTPNCNASSTGSMRVNAVVSGVRQRISVVATTPGSYNISTAQVNGVTFAASGNLNMGPNDIELIATGTPASAAASPYSYTINTIPSCTFSRTVNPVALPANITLSAISPHFVASIFDNDYAPYSAPTGVASFVRPVAAGGGSEPLIDLQGTLTTTGVSISIPYTVTGTSPVNLPPYSQTITIPAASTEDNNSRDVSFSYSSTTLGVGPGTITATLRAIGGILNVKKLDIQAGVGSDNLGVLLAQFTYATNSTGATANFQYRAIAGIPDRNFNDANHRMLYLPVPGTRGTTWLNNNLGANYSNTTRPQFNPARQAASSGDHHAYGSLFQWGRTSDGHELINWTSSTVATVVNTAIGGATLPNGVSSFTPGPNFIAMNNPNSPYFNDWLFPKNTSLWQAGTGTNNPCPIGFRVPTYDELNDERNTWFINGVFVNNPAGALISPLKWTLAGNRNLNLGDVVQFGNSAGFYWSSSVITDFSRLLNINSPFSDMQSDFRSFGMSVRCIKE